MTAPRCLRSQATTVRGWAARARAVQGALPQSRLCARPEGMPCCGLSLPPPSTSVSVCLPPALSADWIDGLDCFQRHIQHKGWLGGWLMPQVRGGGEHAPFGTAALVPEAAIAQGAQAMLHDVPSAPPPSLLQEKSYFAVHLPHGWWVFGLDLSLVDDIDMCQYRCVPACEIPPQDTVRAEGEQARCTPRTRAAWLQVHPLSILCDPAAAILRASPRSAWGSTTKWCWCSTSQVRETRGAWRGLGASSDVAGMASAVVGPAGGLRSSAAQQSYTGPWHAQLAPSPVPMLPAHAPPHMQTGWWAGFGATAPQRICGSWCGARWAAARAYSWQVSRRWGRAVALGGLLPQPPFAPVHGGAGMALLWLRLRSQAHFFYQWP